MASWFCSSFCQTANESNNQIILVNNKTQEVVKYGNSLLANKQMNLHNGFIMLRKSMYEKYIQKCQQSQKPFTDNEFPPTNKSISQKDLSQLPQLSNKTIIWKRIPELYKNCDLIKDRIQPADIQQGNIGDCYFLAAISALAQNENNILQIFGKKDLKSMVKNEYGIYKFVINVAGQPQQVVVDDFIPVYAKSQRPVFCKPVNNQFWVVLLQKVWAKINKSYRNIAYGNPHQVLNRFSVAPVFYHNIPLHFYLENKVQNSRQAHEFQAELWQNIIQGHKQNFPMCCGSRQKVRTEGIKPCHSYSLLAAFEIIHKGKQVRLLKLRNPWGHTEYSGNFSEKDPIWDAIDIKIKNQILEGKQNDGIFIIPFEQFLINFESIDISHTKPHYNYIFKPVQFSESQQHQFYRISIENQGQVYLTFEKQYIRDSKLSQYHNNGISKILVAQQLQNGNLQFIDCALETSLADVTVRCKRLKPGSYIVMVSNQNIITNKQSSSTFYATKSTTKSGTLSVYSKSACMIQKLPQVRNFLTQFFYTHAVKYNRDKKKIGAFENDWISKKIITQSGYGYICISLDERGSKRFLISIKRNLIQKQGFQLILPLQIMKQIQNKNYTDLQLEIRPGQCFVFLFKIDYMRQNLTLSFPPQGFDIKKII